MRTRHTLFVGALLIGAAFPALGESKAGCTTLDAVGSKKTFSATSNLNVAFTATVVMQPKLEALPSATLVFTTPKGHVYQEVDIPIAAPGSDGATEKTRKIPGYPHPVEVVHGRPDTHSGNPNALVLSLPPLLVGGTAIQQSGLYGKWRAELRVSGDAHPCAVSFVIGP